MTAIESIKKRYSVRTYSNKPITLAAKKILQTSIHAHNSGPLGSSVRFELVQRTANLLMNSSLMEH